MLNTKLDPSLAVAFDLQLAAGPDVAALVIEDESWTRAQLAELAARALGTLLACGVVAGDRIVVQYDTGVEDVALALAAARIGATLLPIPKRMGVREINYILERSEASFFAHVGDVPPAGIVPPAGAALRSTRSTLDARPAVLAPAKTHRDQIALIGVTSGSTGQPKGVMHGWSGVAWAAERMRALADVQPGEAILVTGAGAGAPGFTFFTYLGLAHGATIVRAARWDPARVLALAHRYRCVWSTMVPTMLQMLIEARPAVLGEGKLEHMRAVTVGGSFMSPELIQRARDELGIEVLRMYAMAECMSHSSMLLGDSEQQRDTFDGRSGPGAELAVFSDAGERLGIEEVGEVGMRGPSLLRGYLGDPNGKSSLMTKDGFFLSGDLGKVTAEGFVKIVGRKKDMIIRGGFNIDPAEVEELLKQHPAVAKVVVVGYPDPKFGEKACAVIEPVPGQSMAFEAMTAFLLAQGLSKEKLPERLELREALPLSPDGKILKARVRQEIGTDPAKGV